MEWKRAVLSWQVWRRTTGWRWWMRSCRRSAGSTVSACRGRAGSIATAGIRRCGWCTSRRGWSGRPPSVGRSCRIARRRCSGCADDGAGAAAAGGARFLCAAAATAADSAARRGGRPSARAGSDRHEASGVLERAQRLLDLFEALEASLADTASALGCSTNQLVRLVVSEPHLLRRVNQMREQRGLGSVRA